MALLIAAEVHSTKHPRNDRKRPLLVRRVAHRMIYSSGQDPLVHYGRHFGWTVHAMCSIHAIITKGIMHAVKIAELEVGPEEALNDE